MIDRAGGRSREALVQTESRFPTAEGAGGRRGQLYLAPTTARVFDNAEKIAQKGGDSYVTVERLLLAWRWRKAPTQRRSSQAQA